MYLPIQSRASFIRLLRRFGFRQALGIGGFHARVCLTLPSKLLYGRKRWSLDSASHEGHRELFASEMQTWRVGGVSTRLLVQLKKGSAQPTVCASRFFALTRMPNIHRLEVGAVGIRIANTLQDTKILVFDQAGNTTHGWMQTCLRVELDNFLFWNG